MVDTALARQWLTGADVWGAAARPVLAPLMRALAPWLLVPPRHAVDTLIYAASAPADEVSSPNSAAHESLKHRCQTPHHKSATSLSQLCTSQQRPALNC